MNGEAGGSAQVLRAAVIEGGAGLAGAFNAARDQEYGEVISGCDGAVGYIRHLTTAGCFRSADLAGQDAELARLSARYEATRALDVPGAARAEQARSALAACRAVLDDFARSVDQAATASPAEPRSRRSASRLSGWVVFARDVRIGGIVTDDTLDRRNNYLLYMLTALVAAMAVASALP